MGALLRETSQLNSPLYVYGGPGRSKTELTSRPLEATFGPTLFGRVETTPSSFQFSDVVDKPIVLYNDFVLSKDSLQTLLQLIEGDPTLIARKYKKVITVQKNHHLFFSNSDLEPEVIYSEVHMETEFGPDTFAPLRRRLRMMSFNRIPPDSKEPSKLAAFKEKAKSESLGYCIFASLVYSIYEHRSATCSLQSKDLPDLFSTPESLGLSIPEKWLKDFEVKIHVLNELRFVKCSCLLF